MALIVIEVFICSSGISSNKRPHVAQMVDRHADLADLAARQFVIAIIAGLRRQIEGDRKPGLPLGQIAAIKRVRGRGGGMAGIGAEQPRGFLAGGRRISAS